MLKHTIHVPPRHVPEARDIAVNVTGHALISAGHQSCYRNEHGRLITEDVTLVTVIEDDAVARNAILMYLVAQGVQDVRYETADGPLGIASSLSTGPWALPTVPQVGVGAS